MYLCLHNIGTLLIVVIDFSFVQATFAEIVSEALIDEVKDAVTNMVSSVYMNYMYVYFIILFVSFDRSLSPP